MKVRITKAEDVKWYADRIGEVFEVYERYISDTEKVFALERDRSESLVRHILPDDCEIVNEWYKGLTESNIAALKTNPSALIFLIKSRFSIWMANAFREMPSEDRMFLNTDGVWKIDAGKPVCHGMTYRLRGDWERPDDKSELVKLIEKWEVTLKRITEPLDLIGSRPVKDAMQQALEAGLCEYHIDGKWRPVGTKTDFAIRLAPDWRDRLKEKGGAL